MHFSARNQLRHPLDELLHHVLQCDSRILASAAVSPLNNTCNPWLPPTASSRSTGVHTWQCSARLCTCLYTPLPVLLAHTELLPVRELHKAFYSQPLLVKGAASQAHVTTNTLAATKNTIMDSSSNNNNNSTIRARSQENQQEGNTVEDDGEDDDDDDAQL